MTLRGRIISFFPVFQLVCIAAVFLILCQHFSLGNLVSLIFSIYFLPVVAMRIHHYFSPLQEGTSNISEPCYSAWWASYQFQAVFNAIPTLEAILRLIPGLYSAWLRLWGSKIGKQVYWTSLVEITDRSLLTVGDKVIFGHKVACYAHVIIHKPDNLLLYVKRITIGKQVFLGAGSRLGPGVQVDDNVVLGLLTDVAINQHVQKE